MTTANKALEAIIREEVECPVLRKRLLTALEASLSAPMVGEHTCVDAMGKTLRCPDGMCATPTESLPDARTLIVEAAQIIDYWNARGHSTVPAHDWLIKADAYLRLKAGGG